MEDVKSMKENGPSECSIVSEASILNEDRANGAASETSENIDGKMSHEMQASDSCKAEHDDGGGYLEEDQPSPSGNLIISTSSPVNESETGIITFETESPQLEALLPLPENPEPLERRRDENSTALPESLPLSVLDAKPSDSGSLPAAHTQDPAIIQDASPSLPSNSNSDTLKLPEEPISVLPNQSETGPTIASELSTEITSPGNGADTPSTSSHSAREAHPVKWKGPKVLVTQKQGQSMLQSYLKRLFLLQIHHLPRPLK